MRTTINFDDSLLAQVQKLSGLNERTALLCEALLAWVQSESAQRPARLGGMEQQLAPVSRRQTSVTA